MVNQAWMTLALFSFDPFTSNAMEKHILEIIKTCEACLPQDVFGLFPNSRPWIFHILIFTIVLLKSALLQEISI